MSDTKIVGIGGLPRSGKDSLAELFLEVGYFGASFGDIVRGFAFERHKDKPDPISVVNMTETSNWLRETRGPEVILDEVLRQYEEAKKTGKTYHGVVLWSIRAPVEVDYILARHGELIWVEASDEVRHHRLLKHMRQGEQPVTLEEFQAAEAKQWQPQPDLPREVQMDISYVKEHATRTLENNEDNLETFLQNAHDLIKSLHVS